MEYSNFGLKARMIMLQKDIKVVDLAKQLEISPTYVSEILKGTRKGVKYRDKIKKILQMEE